MRKARKAHGDKVILDDVTLSFYPARRSASSARTAPASRACCRSWRGSTSRPTATPSSPRATPSASWSRSRSSTRTRTCSATSRRASPRPRAARPLQRDLRAAWRPDADYDTLLAEMGKLQETARPRQRLGPRLPARAGDGRAALPAAGRRRHGALRWRAPPGRAVQAAARAARPAAARRADQPPRRRERAVAGAAPGEVPRHRRRRHARPVLPRQRRPVDPRARPRPRLPVRGQLLDLPRDEGSPAQGRGAEGRQARRSGSRTSSSGCAPTRRPARPRARPGSSATRRWPPRPSKTRKLDFDEIQIPPGPRLGSVVVEADEPRPRASTTGC